MFQSSLDQMMDHLLSRRSGDDNIRHFPISQFGDANFIQVKDAFSWMSVPVLREGLDRFIEKTSWYLGALRFVRGTFHFT
jgi:hypothetical protein